MTRVTRGRGIAAAIVLSVMTVACSGPAEPSPKKVPLEKSVITVGVVPSADSAPLYLAMAKGYFEREGLTVKATMITGGAAAIPQLKSAALDLTQADYVTALLVQRHDEDVKVIADLYQAAPGAFGLMVKADSRVGTVAGLKGKSIAVNNLLSIGMLASEATLKGAGLTKKDVKFIEVPFPEMERRLAAGEVDAAWLPEPWGTSGQRSGSLRRLADPMTGDLADLPVGGWVAAGTWRAANPATLAAFQRGIAAGQRAAGDRAEVEAVLPTYLKIDADSAAQTRLGVYPPVMATGKVMDERRLQRVADLMRDYGYLKDPLDVKSVVAG
ncbi:ABC transporter substrate-binding protein [Nonomuraea cavernae]|uniref:ABC transporter substrate-binding protein n=1 Tax=Nonomuraea cavernae TaxID=2045107 RepID=UPI003407606C